MNNYCHDLIPGLRIILDNPLYNIKHEHASGCVFIGEEQKQCLFTLFNSICTPPEVPALFHTGDIIRRILDWRTDIKDVIFLADRSGFMD